MREFLDRALRQPDGSGIGRLARLPFPALPRRGLERRIDEFLGQLRRILRQLSASFQVGPEAIDDQFSKPL
jgi:hypothetical protein